MDWREGQKVRVKRGHLSSNLAVPARTVGKVIQFDDERSSYGYNVLVCWNRDIPRSTWIPETALEVL